MILIGTKRERYPVESLPRSLPVKTEEGKVVLYQLSYFRMILIGAKGERYPAVLCLRSRILRLRVQKYAKF